MKVKQNIELITAKEVADRYKDEKLNIIDVRQHDEIIAGKIPGAKHIPLGEMLTRYKELDREKEYIIVCRSGNRSGLACEWLMEKGFMVKNMVGGMISWASDLE